MGEELNLMLSGLGRKIKGLRENSKITLKELADKTGVTPSLLSQIENGKAAPSLTTLKSIADVFEVPIGYLFDSSAKSNVSPVVRKNAHRRIITDGNVRHTLLSPGVKEFESLLMEFPPNTSTGRDKYSHEGVECAYIVKGSLSITLENDEYHLNEGDSIVFESHREHLIKNISDETAIAIWVDSRRWFFVQD